MCEGNGIPIQSCSYNRSSVVGKVNSIILGTTPGDMILHSYYLHTGQHYNFTSGFDKCCEWISKFKVGSLSDDVELS